MPMLMPVGGDALWGNTTWSPDGVANGHMFTFAPRDAAIEETCAATDGEGRHEGCVTADEATPQSADTVASVSASLSSSPAAAPPAVRQAMRGPASSLLGVNGLPLLEPVERSGLTEGRRRELIAGRCGGGHAGGPVTGANGTRGLTASGAHALLRESAPHFGALVDAQGDIDQRTLAVVDQVGRHAGIHVGPAPVELANALN